MPIKTSDDRSAGLTRHKKQLQTQWTTTFLAAAELVRRGYTVSFTTGNNTPIADLMVGTNTGEQFWVDVKGLSYKNRTDWLMRPKPPFKNLFYILVHLSPPAEPGTERLADQYYVLTQEEANKLERKYRKDRPNNKTNMPGFRFPEAMPYLDRWDQLPRPA